LLGYQDLFELRTRQLTVVEPAPPRVWVARCASPGGALEVRAPDFPRKACVTRSAADERQEPVPPGAAGTLAAGAGWLDVEAEGPGWLVTVEPWYPGWTASVGGVERPVEVLDGALVGLALPEG